MATNDQIADLFDTYVYWMTASGNVSSYKISTFKNAAYVLRNTSFQVCSASPQQIKGIKGIGDSLRAIIVGICQREEFLELEELMETIPEGIVEMSRINGLGPKKINTLWREYNIDSIDKLEEVINSGALLKIKGYGKASVEKISKNLRWLKENKGKNLYAHVAALSLEVVKYFEALFPDEKFILIGDIVRKSNVISSIDILTTVQLDVLSDDISLLDKLKSVLEDKITFDFEGAIVQLFYHSLEGIEAESHRINFTLEGELLDDERPVIQVEKYYQGLKPNQNDLIEYEDIKGLIHCHSTYSDGKNSLLEMAERCIELGLEYMVISDHSHSAFYANGLFVEDMERQAEEIQKLNEQLSPFRIFKSIECDILTDGKLDYPNEVLDLLDMVIISIHSGLEMDKKTATERLLKAIENPNTSILGHMTGRLLLRRKGYEVDIEKIATACIENNVAIEINANPRRLDVDAYYLPYLLSRGVKVSINPDAHSLSGIEDNKWGVINAQKGGVKSEDNISSLALQDFIKFHAIQ